MTDPTARAHPGKAQSAAHLPPKEARHGADLRSPTDKISPQLRSAGSGEVLVDSRGVDARHNAVGVAAEAPQLLWGEDVDDE